MSDADDWNTKNEALRTKDAKRMNGAFLAFNPSNQMEWAARRLIIAAVLDIAEAAVDRGIEEMKRVGLIQEHWLQ